MRPPAADASPLALALLAELRASTEKPDLPIQTHAQRIKSGERGLSLEMLRALREFYRGVNALNKTMGDVCKQEGFDTNVCALTRSTGLSLAESLVYKANGRDGIDALIGHATTFFSYSWTGTRLDDMLYAVEKKMEALEKEDGKRRFAWIDMFCASQNLLDNIFYDAKLKKGTNEYAARKEDTDHIFDDAIDAVNEILFYCSPLTGEWKAPPHPYLLADRGEPPKKWMRTGPGAATRAWCVFEMAKTLAKNCKLHIVLSRADVDGFEELLTEQFDDIAKIVANIDARDAQISKVDDREYIMGEVAKLGGGLGAVTATVCGALRTWLAEEGRAALERMPAGNKDRPLLLNNLGLLKGFKCLNVQYPLQFARTVVCFLQ